MSSRHLRRLRGDSLPPPDSDSDGDFNPMAYQPQRSTYAGLEVSSESDPERSESKADEESDDVPKPVPGGARKKVIKKTKIKAKTRRKNGEVTKVCLDEAPASVIQPFISYSSIDILARQRSEPLDEIDLCVMEVNELLGTPKTVPVIPVVVSRLDQLRNSVLKIDARHLNVSRELRRLFGPDDPLEIRERTKAQPHRERILRRVKIGPTHETPIYNFRKLGLSMSVLKQVRDITYFLYDHDEDHQRKHHAFMENFARLKHGQGIPLTKEKDYLHKVHVEHLLEVSDILFRNEDYTGGNRVVENVVTYLQFVAHPSMDLASVNTRLLYAVMENRPFHVAMLKYLYLLSNKACHRTALEIAKMLLNVDPCDPLAVLFVIDTLAIRAREHQWLIDATVFFNEQRQANMMFNIQYSLALAYFHVALKTKDEFFNADRHIQIAIKSYPEVLVKILQNAQVKEPKLLEHTLFTKEHGRAPSRVLDQLTTIYAKLIYQRWREPEVMKWLLKNAFVAIENYDNFEQIRREVRELADLRQIIFRGWPIEILRHILVIKSMSNLLIETKLEFIDYHPLSGWDPLFDNGLNRYSYRLPNENVMELTARGRSLLNRYTRQLNIQYRVAYMAVFCDRSMVANPWASIALTRADLVPPRPARSGSTSSTRFSSSSESSESSESSKLSAFSDPSELSELSDPSELSELSDPSESSEEED